MVLVVRGVLGVLGRPVHQLHRHQFLCHPDDGDGEREMEREGLREGGEREREV